MYHAAVIKIDNTEIDKCISKLRRELTMYEICRSGYDLRVVKDVCCELVSAINNEIDKNHVV